MTKRFDTELQIRIEKYDKKWLKSEAKKKKLSIAGLIRHWINYFKNENKNNN